jgi:hypothetical protein
MTIGDYKNIRGKFLVSWISRYIKKRYINIIISSLLSKD